MKSISHPTRTLLLTLVLFWALLFLGHGWEDGLKLDGMTNSILAKHILSTGDWKVFHYTPSAYPDYYPHPPFAIWTEALAFKIFGISDFTARLSPALFGLGTVLGVFCWGFLSGGAWEGFLAAIVLLSSTRYLKYAADAFLEGPLAFFFVWAGVVFLYGRKFPTRRHICFHLFGFLLAFSFLTKSIFALTLPLGLLGFYFYRSPRGKREVLELFLASLASCILIIGAWFIFGDGLNFLRHHWDEISSRAIGKSSFSDHFQVADVLLRTYWPWLPIFIFAVYRMLPRLRREEGEGRVLALSIAMVILVGFTYSGFLFEHYLTPFYPVAALIVAPVLAGWLKDRRKEVESGLRGLAVALAVLLAIFPFRIHGSHTEPLKQVFSEIDRRCKNERTVKEIEVSRSVMETWMAIAVSLWLTPYEASSVNAREQVASPGALLITSTDDLPNVNWEEVPLHSSPKGIRLFQSRGSKLCLTDAKS